MRWDYHALQTGLILDVALTISSHSVIQKKSNHNFRLDLASLKGIAVSQTIKSHPTPIPLLGLKVKWLGLDSTSYTVQFLRQSTHWDPHFSKAPEAMHSCLVPLNLTHSKNHISVVRVCCLLSVFTAYCFYASVPLFSFLLVEVTTQDCSCLRGKGVMLPFFFFLLVH